MRVNLLSRTIAVACLGALSISISAAQDWAKQQLEKSPRHREWATIEHDGRKVEAFIAYPEVSGKAPVVLVIHEIFGMSDWVQEVADEFAAAGYIAIAPDLLSGMGPGGKGSMNMAQADVVKAVGGLDPDQVTGDLKATADYGLKLPSAARKLYVAGFCWGGGQTFRFATNRTGIAAAFVFYGPPPAKDAMARITAPVYGFFAGNDARIGAMVPGAVDDMKAAGKTFEPVTYEGAGHGFMRAGDAPEVPDADKKAHDAWVANKKAREESWVRLKKLLSESGMASGEAQPDRPKELGKRASAMLCCK